MTLNLATMHGFVAKEIASKRTLRESMDRIIAKCAKGLPHDDWEKIAALPYDDLDDLREWIEKPFRDEPSKKKARRPADAATLPRPCRSAGTARSTPRNIARSDTSSG